MSLKRFSIHSVCLSSPRVSLSALSITVMHSRYPTYSASMGFYCVCVEKFFRVLKTPRWVETYPIRTCLFLSSDVLSNFWVNLHHRASALAVFIMVKRCKHIQAGGVLFIT